MAIFFALTVVSLASTVISFALIVSFFADTAISLLFAILNVRPVPFCLFDEVEAALDDANVDSFGEYLDKYRNKTQFIIITHKKKTMEYADYLYGVTMQESGVSKLVSVKLQDLK